MVENDLTDFIKIWKFEFQNNILVPYKMIKNLQIIEHTQLKLSSNEVEKRFNYYYDIVRSCSKLPQV